MGLRLWKRRIIHNISWNDFLPTSPYVLEGSQPPLPGFPGSVPKMIASVTNTRKSVRDIDWNQTDGKRQIDPKTLAELRKL